MFPKSKILLHKIDFNYFKIIIPQSLKMIYLKGNINKI